MKIPEPIQDLEEIILEENEIERDKLTFIESNELLSTINSPEDLRKLEIPQLSQLASEIRDRIITVVSKKGGHLAAGLGVVELTIALHYVFNTPEDKIVWDVGHQAYPHKLLTGRQDAFYTLRQYGGISGFLRRCESLYDVFGAGHASTSISAALGIAAARDLAGEDYRVIAVIGDGAMTGGLAFEGMNNSGALGKDFIVVLNDNKMSISPNAGAISRLLNDIIVTETYNKIKADIWDMMGQVHPFGKRVRSAIGNIDRLLKALVVPGIFFEKLGFRYFGPIDGHNHSELIRIFKRIKELHGPILVHVQTIKGKGIDYAEKDATKWHGVGVAFDKVTGLSANTEKKISYSEVFGRTLARLAETNDRIVTITAAMTDGTGLNHYASQFPKRFFDVGIAEGHAVTFAGGLAVDGYKPVVAIYSTFLQRAYDQIIHDVALQNLNVVFAMDRAGLVGDDGPTHHGSFDLSYLRIIPNMVIMAPKDEEELRSMLKLALEYNEGPIAIRYPRGNIKNVIDWNGPIEEIEFGKAEVIREGSEVSLLSIGTMTQTALEAAEILATEGISAQVVNMRFVKPLDETLLDLIANRDSKIVTVEDNALAGGFGSSVMEFYEKRGIFRLNIKRLGLPDYFIEHGKKDTLMEKVGLNAEGIAEVIRMFVLDSRKK